MQRNARFLRSLFLLRLGLGIFLFMMSLGKLITPEPAAKALATLYYVSFGPSTVMLLGACELVLSLCIILGFYKTISYGTALALHIVSTIAHYRHAISPIGDNFFVYSIPILLAFVSLFLLRNFDTLWTLGKKKSLFAQ